MSYADTKCPCGGTKGRNTMLCLACLDYLKDRPELNVFDDERQASAVRQHAAMILVELARKRKTVQREVIVHIRVREYGGTYIATAVGHGVTASCTAGREQAVERCAQKLTKKLPGTRVVWTSTVGAGQTLYNPFDAPAPRCADCGGPVGIGRGPRDGWQLEDGRTVCHKCCVADTGKIIRAAITAGKTAHRGGE